MSRHHTDFTRVQLEFLELWHIAAMFDCLYVLNFHCMDLFQHDQTSLLTDEERADLARAAQREIFGEAISKGYRPADADQLYGGHDGPLC